jgi:hypothetical protein
LRCLSFAAIALLRLSMVSANMPFNQEPMPRYHFHFRAGSSIFKDEVGEVFADASLALQHAKQIALELVRGGEPTDASIIIAEADRNLFEVPLSEHGH